MSNRGEGKMTTIFLDELGEVAQDLVRNIMAFLGRLPGARQPGLEPRGLLGLE